MRIDIVNDDARHRRGRAHGVSRAGGVVCRLRRGVKLSESTRPRVSQTRCRWHRGGTIGGGGIRIRRSWPSASRPGPRRVCGVCVSAHIECSAPQSFQSLVAEPRSDAGRGETVIEIAEYVNRSRVTRKISPFVFPLRRTGDIGGRRGDLDATLRCPLCLARCGRPGWVPAAMGPTPHGRHGGRSRPRHTLAQRE